MAAMTKARAKEHKGQPKSTIALNQACNIPLNKLVLSEANVRKIYSDAEIATIADSIAQRSLLQSLSVRAVLDGDTKTGVFAVQAGGRRLRALQLLAKQKRVANDVLVPCIIKSDGIAEDDSLAENTDREDLHPLDEFRAFATLRDKGQGDEQIAATHHVTPLVVRQRLRLAAASPRLLDAYGKDDITLDELMAFCITTDHARQDQVFDIISKQDAGSNPHYIRRLLTETGVEATDDRAKFVGLDAYQVAGGTILRDLFEADGGGWLQDPALLTRLAEEKLAAVREAVLAQGWKWVHAAVEIPYTAKQGLLHATPLQDVLSKKEVAQVEKLSKEHDALTEEHGDDDMPGAVRAQLEEIEVALNDFENRPAKYDPEDISRGGAFVTINHEGRLGITYGFIKPEDMPKDANTAGGELSDDDDADPNNDDDTSPATDDGVEEGQGKPIPESLTQDLTSYRTVAMRDALAQNFDVAFVSVLHAMCLDLFYHASFHNVLQVTLRSEFPANAPGLGQWERTKDVDKRHAAWKAKLPRASGDVWQALQEMDNDTRALLFAHCASMTINAVRIPHLRRSEVIRNADRLVTALGLDMVHAGWTPTAETYLGRVTKAHILDAVREAKGKSSMHLIEHLKKPEMVKEAARLLEGTGWLPQVLRNTEQLLATVSTVETVPEAPRPAFLDEKEAAAA